MGAWQQQGAAWRVQADDTVHIVRSLQTKRTLSWAVTPRSKGWPQHTCDAGSGHSNWATLAGLRLATVHRLSAAVSAAAAALSQVLQGFVQVQRTVPGGSDVKA